METARTLVGAMMQVGARGLLRVEGDLLVPVRVLDARSRWGTRDLLVMPVDGEGKKWVQEDRVQASRGCAPAAAAEATEPIRHPCTCDPTKAKAANPFRNGDRLTCINCRGLIKA